MFKQAMKMSDHFNRKYQKPFRLPVLVSFCAVLGLPLFATQNVIAHVGGHGGPAPDVECKKSDECSKDEISQGGLSVIARLIERNKIDQSWKLIKAVNSITKNNGLWLVTYKNVAERDKTKQILYVFISSGGYLAGANFSGQ